MKRTRYAKSWSNHNLPLELWSEILSRLPVKSLLRLRCVSKSWQTLIGDPNFCQLHLKKFKNNHDETHLFVTHSERVVKNRCAVRCSNTFKIKARLDSLDMIHGDNERWNVYRAMDGLVLLRQMKYPPTPTSEFILWNPSIRKTRPLPPSPPILEGMKIVELDIGFDPLVKDYKLVRIVNSDDNNIHSVAIYTLGTDSWKTIQLEGKGCFNWRWHFSFTDPWIRVCFRGVHYFVVWNLNSKAFELLLFDWCSEVFASISLPVDGDLNPTGYGRPIITLVGGGCSLGMVFLRPTQGSIWVLESYGGDTDSPNWIKRFTFASRIPGLYPKEGMLVSFLFLKKNGDMLVRWRRRITLYNLETKEDNTLLCNSRGFIISVHCYIESLLLLNG